MIEIKIEKASNHRYSDDSEEFNIEASYEDKALFRSVLKDYDNPCDIY